MNDKEQRFATMTTEEPGAVEARVRRRLITLAKIAFLIVALTCLLPAMAGAFSKKVVLDSSVSDFTSADEFYLVGVTQLGGVAGVQLLAVGLSADPGWLTETTASGQVEPLPYNGVTDLAATSFGRKLIIAGGVYGTGGSSTYSRSVCTATVRQTAALSDTDALTPWVTQTAQLPQPRSAAALVVSPTGTVANRAYLYLIGGYDGSQARVTVYRSIFTPTNGQVGPWVTDTLPIMLEGPGEDCGLQYHSAVVFGGRIYVIGGERDTSYYCPGGDYDYLYSNKVYVARIQSNGTLTTTNLTDYPDSWALLTQTLPMALSKGAAAVYDGVLSDTIYFVGGENGVTNTAQVYYTDILSGGNITRWYTSEGNLPVPRSRHGAGFSRGQFIVAGGVTDFSDPDATISSTIMAAVVKEDEANRRLMDWCKDIYGNEVCSPHYSWISGPLLPQVRRGHAVAVSGNDFFVLGGEKPGSTPGSIQRSNIVYHGSADAAGGTYPPSGRYTSKVFDLKSRYGYIPQRITHLEWQATVPISTGLTISYRYSTTSNLEGVGWSTPITVISGTTLFTITPPITTAGWSSLHFQYQGVFTSNYPYKSTARLTSIAVYADMADPDLGVSKVANQPFATSGKSITYTIYYSNAGQVEVNAILTDIIPQYTTIVPDDWSGTGDTYTRSLYIGPNVYSQTVTIAAKVEKAHTAQDWITNTAWIAYAMVLTDDLGNLITDPTPYNNVATATLPITPVQIAIGKSVTPYPYAGAGNIVTYTLRITVTGGDSATNVVITDHPDAKVKVLSYTSGCGLTGGALLCGPWGELGPNSYFVTYTARITSPLADGTEIINTAQADADQWPVVSDVLTLTVLSRPELHIAKTSSPSPGSTVVRGGSIQYTLSYYNIGTANATGVVITDCIEAGVPVNQVIDNVSGAQSYNLSTGVITPYFSSLVGVYSGTLATTFTVHLDGNAPEGSITNTAYIRSAQVVTPTASNAVTHTVIGGALLIGKVANPAAGTAVLRGSYITYTIYITNIGEMTVTNAAISDALPLQTTYKSNSCVAPAGGTCGYNAGVVTWTVPGSLVQNDSRAMTFTVQVIANATVPGVIANNYYTVTGNLYTGGQADPGYGSLVTHSLPAPVLSVSKTSYPASGVTVTVGSYIQYMLHYVNDSDQGAIGGKLFDFITGPVQIVNAAGGSAVAPPPPYSQDYNKAIRWDLGTIPGHADVWKVIRVQITGTDAITNLVVLSSTDTGDVVGNTLTHSVGTCAISNTADLRIKSLTCTNCSGSAQTYYTVYTDSKLNISVKVQNDGGEEAASPFEICSPCSSPAYPKLQQCCSRGGTTTEIYAIHILSPTQPITPDNHTYGCEWDSVNHECTRQQYSAWPPDTYRYPTDCYFENNGTKYVCPASIPAQGGSCTYTFPSTTTGTIELPILGWWYIYAQADTYYDKSPWTDHPPTSPDWGAVNEGCAESNNVDLVLVNVREKQQGGGVYLPIILKNKN